MVHPGCTAYPHGEAVYSEPACGGIFLALPILLKRSGTVVVVPPIETLSQTSDTPRRRGLAHANPTSQGRWNPPKRPSPPTPAASELHWNLLDVERHKWTTLLLRFPLSNPRVQPPSPPRAESSAYGRVDPPNEASELGRLAWRSVRWMALGRWGSEIARSGCRVGG